MKKIYLLAVVLMACNESTVDFSQPLSSVSYSSSAAKSSSSFSQPIVSYKDVKRTSVIPEKRQIIGYYPSWEYDSPSRPFGPTKVNFKKWTRVTYAFYQTALDGGIHGTDLEMDGRNLFGEEIDSAVIAAGNVDTSLWRKVTVSAMEKRYSSNLESELNLAIPKTKTTWFKKNTGIIDLAHQAGTEVYMSIGGWTLSANFSTMAANESSRNKFASEAVRLVRDYGLDGIDIDWEYPGNEAHKGGPADRQNFPLLLNAVRDSLDAYSKITGRHYGLTAALPCGSFNLQGIDIGKLGALDRFNLMTYDLHGSWDSKVYHHSSLFADYGDYTLSAAGCSDLYIKKGVAPEKINIGIAFYGDLYEGVDSLRSPINNSASTWFRPGNYNSIVTAINEGKIQEKWDEGAQASYAVWKNEDGSPGGVTTYDSPRAAAAKARYVIQAGLSGLIAWDMTGDVLPSGETPILDSMQVLKR